MNTKPTKKRYNPPPFDEAFAHNSDGTWAASLFHPKFAVRLSRIVTEFEHLEDQMAWVLARLTGTELQLAGYLLRSVRSPRGRTDMLRDLLQLAPRNVLAGDDFDDVIAEFSRIGTQRNKYVHGRWFTRTDREKVRFCESDDHRMEFIRSREVTLEELDELLDAMSALLRRIFSSKEISGAVIGTTDQAQS